MACTTQDAERIAKEAGYDRDSISVVRNDWDGFITRAMNLAAAEALEELLVSNIWKSNEAITITQSIYEYRAAAKGE